MSDFNKIAIIGGGSWATALAKILCDAVPQIFWYMRNEHAITHLKTHQNNPNYLSSVEFDPDQLLLTNDMNVVVQKADCLIFAIPSAFVKTEMDQLKTRIDQKIVFSAIKGIVPESGLIVGEHFHKYFNLPYQNFGVISGPCHAEEVALERLSYLTISCSDTDKAQRLANMMHNAYIRCKVTQDVFGAEYAAMLKNIYAIAAGIFHALGYGDNFQSVLMSNAIRETERYIEKTNQVKRNINDSAYLGDLLVTGYSSFSRNRMFGTMIGKGYTVKTAQLEMNMIAEGYYATKSAYQLNQNRDIKVYIPIIEAVYEILYLNKSPKKTMLDLTEVLD